MLFKSATDVPKFVIAHKELYVYGRMEGTKRLLKAERDFFYHCNSDCIRPRHPYFDMCDVRAQPATVRRLAESDNEHFKSQGLYVCI